MHGYIVLASVILPLIGVLQMERGAKGLSVGVVGYPNGATLVYALYALVLLAAYALARRRVREPGPESLPGPGPESANESAAEPPQPLQQDARLAVFARRVLVLSALVLLVMLFGFGGWGVWTGAVGKGEFRAHLGAFGSLAYLLINAVIPMLMAYAAVLHRQASHRAATKVWLGLLFLVTLLIGSTWGFKSTGLLMLLPALVILLWDAPIWKVILLGAAGAATLALFFYLMDSNTTEAEAGLGFLLTRLTVLQGDVSWYLWGQLQEGERFPAYLQTLLVFVGDSLFSAISGITRDQPELWAAYHFDILVGQLAGLPLSVIEEGHSVVGTPFADGLVLGGVPGVLFMAVFAGVLAAVACNLLEGALWRGQGHLCALIATYYGIYVVTFLRNGVVVQLFHVATFVGLALAWGICLLLGSGLTPDGGDEGADASAAGDATAKDLKMEAS